jgi:hypothetical protein
MSSFWIAKFVKTAQRIGICRRLEVGNSRDEFPC